MVYTFSQLVLLFSIYSLLGWLLETLKHSLKAGRFVNRGFLRGPFCPVYGFAMLIIQTSLDPIQSQPLLVLLLTFVIISVLEYLSSLLLEKLFKTRWWDYSQERWQLHGRLSLRNSLIFTLLAVFAFYFLQPQLLTLINLLNSTLQRVVASLIIGIFTLELFQSLDDVATLDDISLRFQDLFEELANDPQHRSWLELDDLDSSLKRLQTLLLDEGENPYWQEAKQRITDLAVETEAKLRLILIYPQLIQPNLDTTWDKLLDGWEGYRQRSASRWQASLARLKQATIRTAHEINPFTEELSFFKLVWVFILGSVLGYVLETLYCLVANGYIESRQGMIYGPFNQLYGFGAVVMVLLLKPLAAKNDRWLFFGGAAIGGIFEYICSWVQELFFGTVSWEYSDQAFSFGGRTSLLYMFFWGILSVVYIKEIYPRISHLISRIPQRPGTFFTWLLIIILSLDMTISAVAVMRWTARRNGEAPSNAYEEYLDERYPDEMLQEIYPNMRIVIGSD